MQCQLTTESNVKVQQLTCQDIKRQSKRQTRRYDVSFSGLSGQTVGLPKTQSRPPIIDHLQMTNWFISTNGQKVRIFALTFLSYAIFTATRQPVKTNKETNKFKTKSTTTRTHMNNIEINMKNKS
jgi:hypothetical protein